MSHKFTISVVICAYNEHDWIASTLDSLSQQLRSADEIVVVDNASTDDTAQIVTDFIAQHPTLNIHLVSEPNKGLHIARETGWRNAHSDIVVTADADMQFPAHWLENYERAFSERPDIAAMTGPYRYYDAFPIIDLNNIVFERINQPQGIGKRFSKKYHFNGGNSAYRRKALEAVEGWSNMPSTVVEDMHIVNKLYDAGYQLWYLFNNPVLASFRRYSKYGWRGYFRYLFMYEIKDYAVIYDDHIIHDTQNP